MDLQKLTLFVLLAAATGCNKEKLDEMVATAKQAATQAASDVAAEVSQEVKSVTEAAGDATGIADTTGKATIKLDAETSFDTCYLSLLTMTGRPTVLKLSSAESGKTDAFPAFLIQGTTDAASVDAVVGQTVAAKLFAQKQAEGPIWYSPDDQPVSIAFAKQGDTITATLANASVISSDSGTPVTISGTFTCALHPN